MPAVQEENLTFQRAGRVQPCIRIFESGRRGLATIGRLVECVFPAFAGHDAALWIEIEENFVFPAAIRQPIAQSDGLGIVRARMAQKDARHAKRPKGGIAVGKV